MSFLKPFVLAAVALPLATAAFAQTMPPGHPGAGWANHGDAMARHKRMCTEFYAQRAGQLASLEARLDLSPQQKAAFAQWRQTVMDGVAKERDLCLSHQPRPNERPTILERQERMEQMLTIKLKTLQASRPALQSLYQMLSPAQKVVIDHLGERRHHRPEHRFGGERR